MAEEKQGWTNSLQGSFGPRQEGLRGQRHPEVEQGSAGGEEEPEPDGHDPCRWKDSPGSSIARQGQGTLQGCLRFEHRHLKACLRASRVALFSSCFAACRSVSLVATL